METGEACSASVSDQPFEPAFHPAAQVVAACLITGKIEVGDVTCNKATSTLCDQFYTLVCYIPGHA
eukprot:3079583-Pyramimonas_sp.AAC.2